MASRAISAALGGCASDQLASSASPPLDTSVRRRSSQFSGPDDAEMSSAPSAQGYRGRSGLGRGMGRGRGRGRARSRRPCTVAQGHVHERASDLSLDHVVRLAHVGIQVAHEQWAVGVRRRPDCVWHSAEDVVITVRVAALRGGTQSVQCARDCGHRCSRVQPAP
eukprot:scaffold92899_cov59-Phaeocystis_antarctica.AAC.1